MLECEIALPININSGISDITLLKSFGINTRVGRVKDPIQVEWNICLTDWIKVNMDSVARDTLGLVVYAGIFRSHNR